MTQQEMINILNHYTLDYNLTWDEIKYDADKAIMRINSHLGAIFPKMSEIMSSPNHHYSIRVKDRDVQIFPERYILSVVIPFIASEVLARDEEFTTIYNKYVLEFENGLYDMFQNEFNRVPEVFKQSIDAGVFFAKDHPQRKVFMEIEKNLPKFVFDVHYHINCPYIELSNPVFDEYQYEYGTTAYVLPVPQQDYISKSGAFVYKFKGWSKDPRVVTELIQADAPILMVEDIHLYAMWERESTLENVEGAVMIKPIYKHRINNLEIPNIVNGVEVSSIVSSFAEGSTLTKVSLPSTINVIFENAFVDVDATFPSYTKSGNLVLKQNAFTYTQPTTVYIPRSVRNMESGAFTFTHTEGTSTICCEILEINKPDEWANDWVRTSGDLIIKWGHYHG